MRNFIFGLMLLAAGCATGSKPKSNVLAPVCEKTAVTAADLASLGFSPAPGKIIVTRLFRVNCPFCKEDLLRIGSFFQSGAWSPDKVQLFLIAYRKEGAEDRKTFDLFMREEMNSFGIPPEAAQAVYVDKDYFALVKARNKAGDPVFEGWRAVPFGLVFGKDGRLAYRGHFTTSSAVEEEHYQFITRLQSENCSPAAAGPKH